MYANERLGDESDSEWEGITGALIGEGAFGLARLKMEPLTELTTGTSSPGHEDSVSVGAGVGAGARLAQEVWTKKFALERAGGPPKLRLYYVFPEFHTVPPAQG